MLRTFLTVGIAWAVGIAIASVHPVPWQAWMILNIIGCLIITIHPAGKTQAIIGGTFLAAFICHGAYGLSVILGQIPDTNRYIQSLNMIGEFRLGLCILWGVSRVLVLAHRRKLRSGHHATPAMGRMD